MSTTAGTPGDPDHHPAPIGALGRALVEVIAPIQTKVLIVTGLVAGGLLVVGFTAPAFYDVVAEVGQRIGSAPAIWLFAFLASALFILAVAVVALLPPLLLRGEDRDVVAVHSWIGAREVRRLLGRASAAAEVLGTPEAALKWLDTTKSNDALRSIRVDALLMVGRHDEARREAEALPQGTPIEAYRRMEALAVVDDQRGLPFDEASLRGAIAEIPPGIDRTEAAVSLAVALARRALPDGDWRKPLLDVRPLVPGSDALLLTRDFGLPVFDVLARKIVVPFLILFFAVAIVTTVVPALLR